jgi:EAL domain-containing protein (putative c-di-GMP-specific phosphodiesterase class I)/CheY-like chemotaxis protein
VSERCDLEGGSATTAIAEAPPPSVTLDESSMQPRILLLDDDPFQLVMQSRMLQSMGFMHVDTSDSAETALANLHRDPQAFDVIVCDLNMPGMDGIEFLQALNASPFRGQVILLSGEGTRIMHTVQALLDRSRLVILGAIEKPAARDAMQALLDRWAPPAAATPPGTVRSFKAADVEAATRARRWVLHYQPKVDLQTGDLSGMEALVRWNHPDHGLVYPDKFIGIAEECGAINALADWVLSESIGQLAIWQGRGLRIRMAVNVSTENLRAPDFARRLGRVVRDAGVSASDVTLEITESRLMSPSPAPLESLVRLRLQRFNLSIDDFGTGHSSLAQLRDVPFTELKVDRGFVHGARFNPIIRPILEGSIGLAKRLGMQSVAEGVETEDDWHLLREIGCDLAQGYFIGRPMPCASVPDWLEAWRERCQRLVAP